MYLSATHIIEREFNSEFKFEHISLRLRKWVYRNLHQFTKFLLNYYISKLHKKLSLFHIQLKGAYDIVLKEYSPEEAKADLPYAVQLISDYRKLMSLVEEVNFFESKDIETVFTKNLELIYKIESSLRKQAFTKSDVAVSTKYEFINQLAAQSLHTIPRP